MEGDLSINVTYKGELLEIPVSLVKLGYTYRILITINGVEIFFEPDEERNYRVIVVNASIDSNKIDKDLITLIIDKLQEVKEQ